MPDRCNDPARLRGLWRCRRCHPIVARFRPGPVVFLLHGVECDRPVQARATLTLRIREEVAA